jgi:CHAT domain-containing protein
MLAFASARLCRISYPMLMGLGGLLVVLTAQPACGQPATTGSKLTTEQIARLQEVPALTKEAMEFIRQGKLEEASATYEKVLLIHREVYGPAHEKLLLPLQTLASLQEQQGNFPAARAWRELRLAICLKVYRPNDWRTVDARLAVKLLDRLDQLTAEEREHLIEAERLNRQGLKLRTAGKTREALDVSLQSLELYQKLLGERQPIYATLLFNVASYRKALGEYAQAEPLYRQALEIRKELLGENHPDYASTLNNLATLHQVRGELAAAESLHLKALEIRKRLLGEEHEDYGSSLNNLAMLYKEQGDTLKAEPLYLQAAEIEKRIHGENHPAYALRMNNLGQLYRERGDFTKAMTFHQQALDIRQRILGEQHADYSQSLNNIADLHRARGDDARAEPLLLQALEIRKQALGENHPDYLTSLSNLAALYQARADYASAERLYRQAIETSLRVSGDQHASHATKLNNLASLYQDQGKHALAEPLYLQALEIKRKTVGELSPDYALGLANLAVYYQTWGELAKAKPLCLQALQIRRRALGEQHPAYAHSLYQLAKLYQEEGDLAAAEPLLWQSAEIRKRIFGDEHPIYATTLDLLSVIHAGRRDFANAENLQLQAREIRKKVLGEQHLDYSTSLSNLAYLYRTMGFPEKGEPLSQQATEIVRQAKGDHHPDYATCLNNEAIFAEIRGDLPRGEELIRQAIEIWKQAFGDQHPKYALGLANLAGIIQLQDDLQQAETLWHRSMDISQRHVELAATAQSERQQLVMLRQMRYVWDGYLSITAQTKAPANEVYPAVLQWKGVVTRRQQLARRLRREGDPGVSQMLVDLQQTSQQLATLAQPTSPTLLDGAGRRRLQELTDQKERQETDLIRHSAAFRAIRDEAAMTPAQMQELLPDDTALVDLLEYVHSQPDKTQIGKRQVERRVVAFVIRKNSIERVELGPATAIAKAVANWRRDLKFDQQMNNRIEVSSMQLQQLVWKPLEPLLDGIQTVLVSPDGSLTAVPFGALPGRKPGTYLIEERGFAVIPVLQMLRSILIKPAEHKPVAPSLLSVQPTNYGPAPSWYTLLQSRRLWSEPKADDSEVAAVKEIFLRTHPQHELTTLTEKEATEKAVRDQIPKYRYVHLDAHGFFTPVGPQPTNVFQSGTDDLPKYGDFFTRRLVTEIHPGLLSGIVLADAPEAPQPNQDDGILTALEVDNLDLSHLELAVLSACETGLGTVAGGEGVLGMQRAFQNAGAQTVVCSLWAVEVSSTRALMIEFYRNLWDKKLGKLESLRLAQLSLMQRFDPATGRMTEGPPDSRVFRADGLTPQMRRPPPLFWAGFVLSGDWR